MKSIVAAIAALAIAVVSAQQTGIVSVTNPVQGTIFTAGEDAIISWTAATATVETIEQIQLANGDANNLSLLDVIATDVDAADGSYTWSIPENITAAADYALIFGVSPNVAYSPRFTIAGPDGSIPSSSAASSVAPSSVAPSSIPSSSIVSASSAKPSLSVSSASASVVSASKSASADPSGTSTPADSAAIQSRPPAVAAFAIVGVAAMAMI